MSGTYKLLVKNARQAVLVCNSKERFVRGEAMKKVVVVEQDGANGVSVVVGSDGCVCAVGHTASIAERFSGATFDNIINAQEMCVLPGLIDGHTHPVWAGDRVHEFAMKLAGASYMDVHKAGGGIHYTVEQTRKASEEELYQLLKPRLERMMHAGTTTAECKSGYGLDIETEVKMLRVLDRARKELPMEISSTYCGAHAVPKGKTAEEATNDVMKNQLPEIKRLIQNGEIQVDNVDVFCEKGVFDVDQSRQILQAGKDMGLAINFHAEELHPINGTEMGAELGARAISHLEEISDSGIESMAKANSVAVILPTTAYILRLKPPPVRKLIDCGVPVALGTDFNPNAFCLSMPLVMHLACVNLRMSMEEALVASTINAAASIGMAETHGSLEVGKVGDLLIINAPRWEHLVYQMAGHSDLISYVIKKGSIVYSRS